VSIATSPWWPNSSGSAPSRASIHCKRRELGGRIPHGGRRPREQPFAELNRTVTQAGISDAASRAQAAHHGIGHLIAW